MKVNIVNETDSTPVKKIVKLWDMCGVGLIVPGDTGVVFTNQVGGTMCDHRSLEGIFIPINVGLPEKYFQDLLTKVFETSKNGNLTYIESQKINAVLLDSKFTQGITVDEERLSESVEAWVYVRIHETELSCYVNFGHFEAVLTWPNSD